ncbi:MAG TPA: cytochrome c oxidase subunit II [Terriglobia bacterium]|nr:cytochrome c oxidase subunit II [Terriglobia bacterium]
MADGKGNGRVTLSGLAFAALLFILIGVSLWMFVGQRWWFTPLISEHGKSIDRVFNAVLIVTGIAFIVVQGLLGFFVARYGASGKERASYWHDNPKAEMFLLIGTAVILTVLVFMGQRAWADIFFSEKPKDALEVHVTAHQFAWEFHYPGPDGKFGRTDDKLVSGTNAIGLDESDPNAKDDVVAVNQFHVPVDKDIVVRLRSQDVIHSFFLPNARVKQDAVPGMAIEIWFKVNKPGEYELACAELCGLGHYRMKSQFTVEASEEDFKKWVQEQWAAAH